MGESYWDSHHKTFSVPEKRLAERGAATRLWKTCRDMFSDPTSNSGQRIIDRVSICLPVVVGIELNNVTQIPPFPNSKGQLIG